MRRITGIGETVLDVIFRDDRPQDAIPGGSTFNALVSLGRTVPNEFPDVPISMVTEVGDDHIGDIIVSFMEKNGVLTDFVTRNKSSRSHLSLAFLDSNNDARYEFYKDHSNAGLSKDITSRIEFTGDDIVLFGSFFAINPVIRQHTRDLLRKARNEGAILYYDINFRKNHIKDLQDTYENICENCAMADFVRGSSEDFLYLFGTEDVKEIYGRHLSALCHNCIITRGPFPTLVYSGDDIWEFPVDKIDTVSTIGAGDNFNAGFIYSLLRYGIRSMDCDTLPYGRWSDMIEVAGRFSSAVCRSRYNYVDENFRI